MSQRQTRQVLKAMAAAVASAAVWVRADVPFEAFPTTGVHIGVAAVAAAEDVPAGVGPVYDASGNTNDINVVNFNTTIYTGPINVATTIYRIANNESVYAKESDDGGFFNFNGNELPNIPRMGMNYYMEFMVWPLMNFSAGTYDTTDTPYNTSGSTSSGDTFPGPERIIVGSAGEVYYTGDHYTTSENVYPTSPVASISVNSLTNTSTGSWSNSANWSSSHVPVAGEAAYLSVQDEGTRTVTYDYTGAAVTLGDFLVNADGTATSHGSMTFSQAQGTLTTAKEEVWARDATAAVIQSGGTDTVNGSLHIGSLVASVGTYNLSGGSLTVGGNEYVGSTEFVAAAGTGTFNQMGGIHTVNGTLYLGFAAGGTGTYLIQNGTLNAAAINVSAGSLLNISGGTVNLLTHTGSLSADVIASAHISNNATLNVTNNALDLAGANLTTISGLIKQGFSNGTWGGSGITSSTAAGTAHLTAVGSIQNNQSGSALYVKGKTFEGATPGPSDILVKYTYYGDANLDGKVDASDYSLIDSGFVTKATGWFNGDFNYDGVINGSDYTLIDNAFNRQGAQLTSEIADPEAHATAEIVAASSVPEPTSVGMLAVAVGGLLVRRKSCFKFAE